MSAGDIATVASSLTPCSACEYVCQREHSVVSEAYQTCVQQCHGNCDGGCGECDGTCEDACNGDGSCISECLTECRRPCGNTGELPCSLCGIHCGQQYDSPAWDNEPIIKQNLIAQCTDNCKNSCDARPLCDECGDACQDLCDGDAFCLNGCEPICLSACGLEECDVSASDCGYDAHHTVKPGFELLQFGDLNGSERFSTYIAVGMRADLAVLGSTDVTCAMAEGLRQDQVTCEEDVCYLAVSGLRYLPPTDAGFWDLGAEVYGKFAMGPPGWITPVPVPEGQGIGHVLQCTPPPGNTPFIFRFAIGPAYIVVNVSVDAALCDMAIEGTVAWGLSSKRVKQALETAGVAAEVAQVVSSFTSATTADVIAHAIIAFQGKDPAKVSSAEFQATKAIAENLINLYQDLSASYHDYKKNRKAHKIPAGA